MRRTSLVGLLALGACNNDQGFAEMRFDDIAVVTGDFDEVEDFLTRNAIGHTLFEGYIVQSVYDEDANPGSIALKAEQLFVASNEDGQAHIYDYDAVVINSGARGFGAWVYNGVEADDDIVADGAAMDNFTTYMKRGGVLIASDWAYDLVETVWPSAVEFFGEAEGLDAAQVGSDGMIVARVTDEDLASVLGTDQLQLTFDYSHWAIMLDAAADVVVHLRGDVSYRASGGEGEQMLTDVPLLVSFNPADGGTVVLSSFSWRAQNTATTDALLNAVVTGWAPKGDNP
jgi:hypothetical protein